MSEDTKLGLTPDQSLKDLICGVADLCTFIINVSHGFSLKEIWEGIGLLGDVKTIGAEIPSLVAQYKGLDDEARKELVSYVEQNVDLPDNQSVEIIVEKVLEVALALSTVFQLIAPKPAS